MKLTANYHLHTAGSSLLLAFITLLSVVLAFSTTVEAATVSVKTIGSYSTADTGSRGSCYGPNGDPYFIVGWGIYRVNLTDPTQPTTYRWKLFGTVSIQGIAYYNGFFYVSQNYAGKIVKIDANNPDSVTDFKTGIDRPEMMDIDYNLKRLVVSYGQKTRVGYFDLTQTTGTPTLVSVNPTDPVTGLWLVQVDQKTSDIFTDGSGALQRFKYNKQSNTYTRSVFFSFSYSYLDIKMVNNYLYIRRNANNTARTMHYVDVRLNPVLNTAFVTPGAYDSIGAFLYMPNSRKFYAVQESFWAVPTPYYGFMEISGSDNPCWACDCQLPNMTCRDCGIYQYCNVPHGNCLMDDACNCTTGWKSNLLDCSTHSCELSNSCTNDKGWCIGPNQCICPSGWKGNSICSEFSCDGVNNCTEILGHGSCIGANQCNCISGWQGNGECSQFSCDASNNCNGNGNCIGPNQCSCNSGWKGNSVCSQYTCDGVNDCSGKGSCIGANQCQCNSGWTGPNCNTFTCDGLGQCNGHGDCVGSNQCSCYTGWKGASDCNTHTCDGVNNCNNHGTCSGPNTCSCEDGWKSNSCATHTCELVNNCNGHGTCSGPNTCSCESGWKGDAVCSQPSCDAVDNCNGNGDCIGANQCKCKPGYKGPSCSEYSCSEVEECNGKGSCTGPNQCTCNSGWQGNGNCSAPSCDAKGNCNGNGECTGPNECTCNSGWKGNDECTGKTCDGLGNCNTHGTCIDANVCDCISGWQGSEDCSLPSCDGVGNCTAHGTCTGSNQCNCDSGWKGDVSCNTHTCDGVNNCNDEGTCTGPNTCTCNSGWKGNAQCSAPSCDGVNDCNGQGTCSGPNTCTCNSGWKGNADCSQPSCDGVNNCNDNGVCSGPNTCTCNSGWQGNSNCSQPSCDGVNNCNDEGTCTGPNTCTCNSGWKGNAQCSAPSCDGVNDCNGQGTCSGPNTCTCNSGWKGDAVCSTPSCDGVNDCNGKGTCSGPNTCSCVSGWKGNNDCTAPSCDGVNNCNGKGSCSGPNTCTCESGWKGNSDCTAPSCEAVDSCSGNGACTGPNTCTCNPSFYGTKCDQKTCLSIPFYTPVPDRCTRPEEIPRKNNIVFYFDGDKVIYPENSVTSGATSNDGGVFGKYLQNSASATLGSSINVDNTFTFIGFFKKDSLFTANEKHIVSSFSLGNSDKLEVSVEGNSDASKVLLVLTYKVAGKQDLIAKSTIVANKAPFFTLSKWHSVTVVRSASSIVMYYDFILKTTVVSDPDSVLALTLPIAQANHVVGSDIPVDEVMLFNTALNGMEVVKTISLYVENCGWTPDVVGGPKPEIASAYLSSTKDFVIEAALFNNDLPSQDTVYSVQLLKSIADLPDTCYPTQVNNSPFTLNEIGCLKKYTYNFKNSAFFAQDSPFDVKVANDGSGLIYTTYVLASYSVNSDICQLYQFVSKVQFSTKLETSQTEFVSVDSIASLSAKRLTVQDNKLRFEGTVSRLYDRANAFHDFALTKKNGDAYTFEQVSATEVTCESGKCYDLVFRSVETVTGSLDGDYEVSMQMDERLSSNNIVTNARTVRISFTVQYSVPQDAATVLAEDISSTISIYDTTSFDKKVSSHSSTDSILLGNAIEDSEIRLPTGFKFIPHTVQACCVASNSLFPSAGCSGSGYTAKANLITDKLPATGVTLATGTSTLGTTQMTATPKEYFLSFNIAEKLSLPDTAQTCRIYIESAFENQARGVKMVWNTARVRTQSSLSIIPPSSDNTLMAYIISAVISVTGALVTIVALIAIAAFVIIYLVKAKRNKEGMTKISDNEEVNAQQHEDIAQV